MKVHQVIWLMVLVILLGVGWVWAGDSSASQADQLYAQRFEKANVTKAVDLLDKAVAAEGYEALWRLARCYWFLGDRTTGKEKLALFEKGKGYAEQAVKAKDNGVEGHYWLASLLGSVGQEKGILNSLMMVSPMKKELDRCLQLNAGYSDAHDVLAQLYWLVPGFPLSIGNKKKAQEEAVLATTGDIKTTGNWLHLGQIAADNKDFATAKNALQKVLALPDDPEDPEASRKDKAAAKDELKKIEGKK
jgi:tetratricopeptide (TPR) repeat protein